MTEVLTQASTERPTIVVMTAAQVTSYSTEALEEARRQFAGIETVPLDRITETNILDAWDRAAIALEDAFGAISLLNSVHPDKEVRDAGDVALIQESSFITELFQNEALYERVRRVDRKSVV